MAEVHAMVALLRGINVGGKNKLAMAMLRDIAAECGFGGALTHLQSGNLVLASDDVEPSEVAARLTAAIEAKTGLDIPIIVRTSDVWTRVVADNPFPAAAADGRTLHVVFLAGPASAAVNALDALAFAPEELAIRGAEIYLHLPDGIGRSKLAQTLMRIDNARTGTVRNWNTIAAVADLLSK